LASLKEFLGFTKTLIWIAWVGIGFLFGLLNFIPWGIIFKVVKKGFG